jgi:hypothetical protein
MDPALRSSLDLAVLPSGYPTPTGYVQNIESRSERILNIVEGTFRCNLAVKMTTLYPPRVIMNLIDPGF